MNTMAGNTLPMQVSLTENEVNKAASEFLTMSSERRKRSRASVTNPAELARKRSGNQPINVESARKSALSLMQESVSFKRLVELEEQLDLAIMRKQQAIREVLKADTYSESRIFRLYIFNTYRSQPGTEGVTSDDVASWSLRIQGKLLPKGETGLSDSVPPAYINDPATPASAHAQASGAAGTSGNNNNTSANNSNGGAAGAGGNAAGSGGGAGGNGVFGNATGSGGATTTNIGGQTGSSSNSGAYGAAGSGGGGGDGAGIGSGGGGGGNNAGGAGHEGAGGDQQRQQTSVITGEEPRCSDVFNRIVVELDKETYGKDNVIEWKRNERDNASDGFEISRPGNKEFVAKIFLFVDHKPTRYRLSNELAQLIGTRYETKSGVFSSVWQYVKKHRLQCVDNRAAVRLDDGLKSLLGSATNTTTNGGGSLEFVKAQSLFALLKNHMGPLDPLKIEYEVRLAGDVVDNQDCYDIHVNVSDMSMIESARKAGVFGLPLSHSSEFEALNERHLQALEKIAHHKKRRDFFEGFCANPVQFINHLILSQTRDLKVLGGSTGRNPEEERHAAFYQQQWVHEAVPRYLLRKAIADTAEDTMESGLKAQQ